MFYLRLLYLFLYMLINKNKCVEQWCQKSTWNHELKDLRFIRPNIKGLHLIINRKSFFWTRSMLQKTNENINSRKITYSIRIKKKKRKKEIGKKKKAFCEKLGKKGKKKIRPSARILSKISFACWCFSFDDIAAFLNKESRATINVCRSYLIPCFFIFSTIKSIVKRLLFPGSLLAYIIKLTIISNGKKKFKKKWNENNA